MDTRSTLLISRPAATAALVDLKSNPSSDYRLSKIIEEKWLDRVKTVSNRDNCIIFEVDRTQEKPLVERILKGGYPSGGFEKDSSVRVITKSTSHVLPTPNNQSNNYYTRSSSRQSIVKPIMNYSTNTVANQQQQRKASSGITLTRNNYLKSLQPNYFEKEKEIRRNDLRQYTVNNSAVDDYNQKLKTEWASIEKSLRSNDALKSEPVSAFKKSKPNRNFVKTPTANTDLDEFNFIDESKSIADKTIEAKQRIICVRHGERVDFTFGPNWTERAFDKKTGLYKRINLNMPCVLPKKSNPWKDFIGDSPLTEMGMMQALLTGEALREKDVFINACYSSPSLRCVQTAHYILKGMGMEKSVGIRIEPGLFEFLGWYERGLPKFIAPKDLRAFGFNIDLSYVPKFLLDRLSEDEKYLDYYNRSFKVTYFISESHVRDGGNILLSGHAGTLESCTRQMLGLKPRSYLEFNQAIRKVSFLGLNMMERMRCAVSNYRSTPTYTQWTFKDPPIPPIQHCQNAAYDWRTIMEN